MKISSERSQQIKGWTQDMKGEASAMNSIQQDVKFLKVSTSFPSAISYCSYSSMNDRLALPI